MTFINKTPLDVLHAVNEFPRHASVALLGYVNIAPVHPSDEDVHKAIKHLSQQIITRHHAATAALTKWCEDLALPRLTSEERWLFEQAELPVLPKDFPAATLVVLATARHRELIPQIEMASDQLESAVTDQQEHFEQLVQLHRSSLKLMTFSRWVFDYLSKSVSSDDVIADNILSPEHAPDVMLFHVMRECRSPMTALIGYVDMLLSLHSFTEEQRNSIVEKINRCCHTIHERSQNMSFFVERWLEETNRESITHQSNLVFGELLRFPHYYAELINYNYLAFIADIQDMAALLYEDPHDTVTLQRIFNQAQFINTILRHSYGFFR